MFKCKICGKEIKRLGTHALMQHGLKPKEYYDKYLKKHNEGICAECGKETKFLTLARGYKKFCSAKCSANNKDTRDTYRKTCLEKYGVDNAWKSEEIKDKIKETNLEKYGVTTYLQTEECKKASHSSEAEKKKKETFIKKYGVDNPLKVPEIQQIVAEKTKITKKQRYGNQNYNNSEKNKQTCLKRYDVDSYTKTEEFKKKLELKKDEISRKRRTTNLKRYGKEEYFGSEDCLKKTVETNLKKYGVKYYTQTDKYLEKANKTKKENNSFTTSKIQKNLGSRLKSRFGEHDVVEEYRSDQYPFNCDFYIKSLDLYIELNAHWTHNNHFFDKNDLEDLKRLKEWEEKSKTSAFFRVAINTWTKRDIKKREITKQNNLKYVVLWNKEDVDEWFKLNCPIGQDWKYEYSWRKC